MNISLRICSRMVKNISYLSLGKYSSVVDSYLPYYDVIVVGGGHAGTEASAAAARMGANTLLVTHKKATIGEMSCNPSFGGIGKGHLVREIDALDGVCGRICDTSGIHYKVLNKAKGPAVWGLRAQIDRKLYKKNLQQEIFSTPNLTIMESSVEDLILRSSDNESIPHSIGIFLKNSKEVFGKNIILTTGTFLRGEIHLGLDVQPAGRIGDEPSVGLAKTLERLKFKIGRLKTGTPPRVNKSNICFSACTVFPADDPPEPFSLLNENIWIDPKDQFPTHLTFTNEAVERIVLDTLHLNHHVKEEVSGPRYCPSIESKVKRFLGRRHQIWLEPEGLDSNLIYPQGISCTMPPEYQQKLINAIPGLEKCTIVQPGYGVEYDFVNPQELYPSLETKKIKNLFFAGQINGTTGYEEAAAQGLVAGVNAAATALGKPLLKIDRTEGYIGVLIDDLTTHGTSEPYRMFTSRSEFRMFLRPDNADIRLTAKGFESGCVSQHRWDRFIHLRESLKKGLEILRNDVRLFRQWAILFNKHYKCRQGSKSALDILGLYDLNISLHDLGAIDHIYKLFTNDSQLVKRLKIEAMYSSIINKEKHQIETMRREQCLTLPPDLDYYSQELSLKVEMREKLNEVRPSTIAAASCIPGITPAALFSLYNHVKPKKKNYPEFI